MKKSIIIGSGTYASVYFEYLKSEYEIVAFANKKENSGGQLLGLPIIDQELLFKSQEYFGYNIFIPIGNNLIRENLIRRFKSFGNYTLPNYIHESVNIHSSCEIKECVYILPGVNIMPFSKIGNNCMISVGTNISHHTVIMDNCFISHGVNIGASIRVNPYCFFGINSTVMTGVNKIGKNCIIGAGSVVINDTPNNSKMVGNPSRNLNDI